MWSVGKEIGHSLHGTNLQGEGALCHDELCRVGPVEAVHAIGPGDPGLEQLAKKPPVVRNLKDTKMQLLLY